jgi:hypothetical protein
MFLVDETLYEMQDNMSTCISNSIIMSWLIVQIYTFFYERQPCSSNPLEDTPVPEG